jgi:hypothetical protein
MTQKDDEFSARMPPRKLSTASEKKLRSPVPDVAKKTKPLSTLEWTFVQELVSAVGSVSAREAAIRAGVPPHKAKHAVERMLDPRISPHIVAAVQSARAEMAEKYGTTYERHMHDLQVIRDQALQAGAYGAAVQAEYRRGQALGSIYIDRKEIRHGTIDSMSKEEVMRKLDEIKRVYGASTPVIDVTPAQVVDSITDDDMGSVDEAEDAEIIEPDETPAEALVEPTGATSAVAEPEGSPDASKTRGRPVRSSGVEHVKLPFYPDRK